MITLEQLKEKVNNYVWHMEGQKEILLDGRYTIEELKLIIKYMKEQTR